MSFYQYHYDAAIFSKLPFIRKLVAYGYRDSTKTFKKGFLCEVSEVDYIKIKVQLKGDKTTPATIVAKDKVYVLPKCSIPGFKLKEYLKAVGATQTTDIKEATKIIGHDDIEADHSHKNSALIRQFSSYYDYKDITDYSGGYYRPKIEDLKKFISLINDVKIEALETQPDETIIDSSFVDILGHYVRKHDIKHFITPTCGMILYYKMLNKIPVVNEEVVFDSIQKPLVIDKDNYETISNMLGSGDPTNQLTAIEIISNCDIDNSLYYLWKLIKNYSDKMDNFRRNKNFRLFRERVNYGVMMFRSEKTILPFLESKGVLTAEIYQELIKEIVRIYKRQNISELFDVTLVPSEKYKKYAPDASWQMNAPKVKVEDTIIP